MLLQKQTKQENLTSRLGFILLSVGCAVGLGNVWRFPYIAGKNGGAIFVLFYLLFIIMIGVPIMIMEFSVGRSSRKSVASAFNVLEPAGTKWHNFKYFAMFGNYLLMMFYTVVTGWILKYLILMASGKLNNLHNDQISNVFYSVQSNVVGSVFWTILVIIIGFSICFLGLQKGSEKITKYMMSFLFLIILILIIKSISLPNADKGVAFFLMPNLESIKEIGLINIISSALSQAFFTLSVGIGSMEIFGSFINKDRKLLGESISIAVLDTIVAVGAGLVIFPACAAFGVDVNSGPGLIFITLPHVFNFMAGGQLWGTLFFLFMFFAALSTVIGVFENIIAFGMDLFNWSRKKSILINIISLSVLCLPCALGFNVLSFIHPLGSNSNIMDLEDFILSANLMPIGSIFFILFCTSRKGWGFDNFIEEANCGKGLSLPKNIKSYLTFTLPILILLLFIQGYAQMFF